MHPTGSILFAVAVAATGAAAGAAQIAPGASVDASLAEEEIVVTARRGMPIPPLEPIEYFRRHCFEALRLTGRPAPPDDDRKWEPLDDDNRRRAGLTDPAVAAYSLVDDTRGHTLVLKFEQVALPPKLTQQRCTMTILGGREHAKLEDKASALFRGPATRIHVGHPLGVPRLAGWQQRLWTGMPSNRSKIWLMRRWIVVTEPRFYGQNNHIVGDLKMREDGTRPVSVLTFAFTSKARPVRVSDKR